MTEITIPRNLGDQLKLISTMSRQQLLSFWRNTNKTRPPEQVCRDLLLKLLAYRLQQQAYGGLSTESLQRLNILAHKLGANPDTELPGVTRIKQGTRLIRDWRSQAYPGMHEAIVSHDVWEQVQVQLQENGRAHKNRSRAAVPSLLTGLVFDNRGNRFTPAHAVKKGKRYQYNVSQHASRNPGSSHPGPVRIPAGEIERLVWSKLRAFLGSSREMLDTLSLKKNSAGGMKMVGIVGTAETAGTRSFIRSIVSRIVVHASFVDVLLNEYALRSVLLRNGSPTTWRE